MAKRMQIRVNHYPNGFWIIIYGKGGVLCSNKPEGIAKLKEQFPGEYEILDVIKPENVKETGPKEEAPSQDLFTVGPAGEKKIS